MNKVVVYQYFILFVKRALLLYVKKLDI